MDTGWGIIERTFLFCPKTLEKEIIRIIKKGMQVLIIFLIEAESADLKTGKA